jgi:hypothetical protein
MHIKRDHCLVGWSGHCYLSACCGAHSDVNDRTMKYGEPGSFEEQQDESNGMSLNTQMIQNVPELQEANQCVVVVGEVGIAACQILAVVLFAIHVVITMNSF